MVAKNVFAGGKKHRRRESGRAQRVGEVSGSDHCRAEVKVMAARPTCRSMRGG